MSIQVMNKEDLRKLKARSKALDPVVWVGKAGISPEIVLQIATFLKKKRLVKIKLLRSFVEEHGREEASKELAEKTDSTVIDQTGFVVVLYK
jgi:RNA-binding protein